MPSPPEFPQFPKLPPELRRMIWGECLAEAKAGRHVLTRSGIGCFNHPKPKHQIETIIATGQLVSHVMRGVCHEARAFFLEFFPVPVDILCYNSCTQPPNPRDAPHRHGVVHLSPATDIFVVGAVPLFGGSASLEENSSMRAEYFRLLERQSTRYPRHVTDRIQNILHLGPFDIDIDPWLTDAQRQRLSGTRFIDAATLPSLRTYKHVSPLWCSGEGRLEWEDIRFAVVRETPRQYEETLEKGCLRLVTRQTKE